ncbi:MAG TPA: S-layer homology domain-containing protein, partial [Chloroflexia bacterium]|nr:S-layer homology domain-containing protein [Chloroflexia bacterium]
MNDFTPRTGMRSAGSPLRGRAGAAVLTVLVATSLALGSLGGRSAAGADARDAAAGEDPQATCPAGGQCFADVPPGNTFYEFANRLYQQDIISGYPCGGPGEPCDDQNRPYYRPVSDVTRQQMTKFVDQARQLPGIFINTTTHGQPIYSRTTVNNGIGLFGESPNGIGLRGIGSPGVRGTSTGGRGVEGTSTNGFGVYGYSNSLSGVYGQSASTGGAGVFGANEANGASAAGVAGL